MNPDINRYAARFAEMMGLELQVKFVGCGVLDAEDRDVGEGRLDYYVGVLCVGEGGGWLVGFVSVGEG